MIQFLLSVAIVVVVVVISLEYVLQQNSHYKAFRQLKGPGPYLPLIGNSLEALLCSAGIPFFFYRLFNYTNEVFLFVSIVTGFRILRENAKRYKNGHAFFAMGQLHYVVYTAENFEVKIY